MPPVPRRPASVLVAIAAMTPLGVVPSFAASTAGGGVETDRSAISEMWLWDNSVDPAVDGRGTGLATASSAEVTAFSVARELRSVHVSAPWASDEGPVAAWLTDTVASLDAAGLDVGVLGGDPEWVDEPALAVRWMRAATHDRAISHVRLDVEPWTQGSWQADPQASAQRWLDMLDAVHTAMPPGVDLSVDAPWWLTAISDPEGPGTLFDAVLRRVERIGIVTFADHAEGPSGIIALSEAAVAAAEATGVPYTIGLETDTPAVAGGSEFTFYDEGSAVLESEAREVSAAFAHRPGFNGVCVEHYEAWRGLIERGALRSGRGFQGSPPTGVEDGLGLQGYGEQVD
jgi:hypothetical protein